MINYFLIFLDHILERQLPAASAAGKIATQLAVALYRVALNNITTEQSPVTSAKAPLFGTYPRRDHLSTVFLWQTQQISIVLQLWRRYRHGPFPIRITNITTFLRITVSEPQLLNDR